jgi:sugar phosphate isomerase/epimerase
VDNAVGVVSVHLSRPSLPEMFSAAKSAGMAAIEWFEGDATGPTEPAQAALIVELAHEHDLANSYHAPWMGPWNLAVQPLAQAVTTLGDLLKRAARLEASVMTLHLGDHAPGADRGAALATVAKAIKRVAPLAEDLGVQVAVENFTLCYGPAALGVSTAEFEMLFCLADHPAVGLNLDLGHAHITGNTQELLGRFGSRLYNTHLHDTDGVTDGHLPFGAGKVDWRRALAAIKATGYAGALNFEFPQTKADAYGRLIELIRRT